MGTISRRAVRGFLDRPLRDSEKAKRLSPDAVDRRLARLDPPPHFATEPRLHQKVTFLLCVRHPRYVVASDMGLGKTKVMLDVFDWARRAGQASRLLVCVRNVSNLWTWEEEAATHAPGVRVRSIHAGVPWTDRWSACIDSSDVDVVAITYAGLCHLVCGLEAGEEGDRGARMVPDKRLLDRVASRFDMLVLDESTEVRRHNSLPARVCNSISRRMSRCYALTGTVIGREPEAAWSQFYIVDRGDTFGATLGLFRSAFCDEHTNYWSGYPEYRFRRSMAPTFHRMLRHGSIRYSADECEDLPPVVRAVRRVAFPQETWAYYERLIAELTEARGNFRLVENAYTRMRQLTSGYMRVLGPEGSETCVEFRENPKLDALVADIRDVPEAEKVIVFHHYTHTGKLIEGRLRREKIRCLRLYGGTRDKAGVFGRFRDDPRVRVLVLNTETGSFSLNLQFARYTLYYESPDDPIIRRQGEKRNDRLGQTGRVFHLDYVVRGSIDERLLAAVRSGRNLFRLLVEGRASLERDDRPLPNPYPSGKP